MILGIVISQGQNCRKVSEFGIKVLNPHFCSFLVFFTHIYSIVPETIYSYKLSIYTLHRDLIHALLPLSTFRLIEAEDVGLAAFAEAMRG